MRQILVPYVCVMYAVRNHSHSALSQKAPPVMRARLVSLSKKRRRKSATYKTGWLAAAPILAQRDSHPVCGGMAFLLPLYCRIFVFVFITKLSSSATSIAQCRHKLYSPRAVVVIVKARLSPYVLDVNSLSCPRTEKQWWQCWNRCCLCVTAPRLLVSLVWMSREKSRKNVIVSRFISISSAMCS